MDSFGDFFCNILYRVAWILPDVDPVMTIGYLAGQLGQNFPFIGAQLLYELLSNITGLLTLAIAYKMMKIIPAKF